METTNTLSYTITEYLGNSLGSLLKFESNGESGQAKTKLEKYLHGEYQSITNKVIGVANFLPTESAKEEAKEILTKSLSARIDVILKALDWLEVC